MGADSKIEWTDHTFSPWWGCTAVSPGCDHCYAESFARRWGVKWGVGEERRTFGDKRWREPLKWNSAAAKAGKRARVFCASMADVFDKDAPHVARIDLWDLIEATPNLDWLLLTKRIGNAERMLPARWLDAMPPNVWLGISVVNQEEADRDIPKLLALPARVRFLSCEPLLGPIDLLRGVIDPNDFNRGILPRLSWVIVGGESGPKARPMSEAWARSLQDQCSAAGVPFFFKQWGEWAPLADVVPISSQRVADTTEVVDGRHMVKVGKRAAGRELDGRTWEEVPR